MLNHMIHSQNNANVPLLVNKLCIVKIVMKDGEFYIR
jgi:hypothetical protein